MSYKTDTENTPIKARSQIHTTWNVKSQFIVKRQIQTKTEQTSIIMRNS